MVILDEPTAKLDPMAEMEVFNRAMDLFKGRTCMLITHRLGAVRRADRIVVLKDSVIDDIGSHEELMAKKGYYFDMFTAQAQWYRAGDADAEEAVI